MTDLGRVDFSSSQLFAVRVRWPICHHEFDAPHRRAELYGEVTAALGFVKEFEMRADT